MTEVKGDFDTDKRLLTISAISIAIGALCSFVAIILLWLIGFFTNLFYFHRFSILFTSPANNTLGLAAISVPIIGGVIVGLMARYGSEKIRGHGIPEALEAILFGKSRMDPKVAVLKPISSAICIGSGGPFGAEGPIIMTGGAFGSIIAQMLKLTAAERKTLLVAGAAAGMSATFSTPVAAVLLSVELLLFEWKPRSLVPVALASAVAASIRPMILGAGPIFPVAPHGLPSLLSLFCSIPAGLIAGIVGTILTAAVYKTEDTFRKFPIHWMWWPAIGGAVVGIGGYFQPHALGVGYDIIGSMLKGGNSPLAVLPLLIVKGTIWAIALGSGTSGGVLAPLLIMGSGLGVLETTIFPAGDGSFWPIVSMAAVMGGVMRAPFTGVVFALELTHDVNLLLPLLIASFVAEAFTVLVMKHSILTEKIARRGYHISCEYSVDLLDRIEIKDVMTEKVVTIPHNMPVVDLMQKYFANHQKHRGYPVLNDKNELMGVLTRSDILKYANLSSVEEKTVSDLVERDPIVAYPHESCREAIVRMANREIGRLLVVSPTEPKRLIGIVTRTDLLKPGNRFLEEERIREQFISLKWDEQPVN